MLLRTDLHSSRRVLPQVLRLTDWQREKSSEAGGRPPARIPQESGRRILLVLRAGSAGAIFRAEVPGE